MRISLKNLYVDIKALSPVFPFNKCSFKNTDENSSLLFYLNTTENQTNSSGSLRPCLSHSTLQSHAKRYVTKTDCVTRSSSRVSQVILLLTMK